MKIQEYITKWLYEYASMDLLSGKYFISHKDFEKMIKELESNR